MARACLPFTSRSCWVTLGRPGVPSLRIGISHATGGAVARGIACPHALDRGGFPTQTRVRARPWFPNRAHHRGTLPSRAGCRAHATPLGMLQLPARKSCNGAWLLSRGAWVVAAIDTGVGLSRRGVGLGEKPTSDGGAALRFNQVGCGPARRTLRRVQIGRAHV